MSEGIRPEPLRQIVYKDLLNRIVTGALEPGEPVRDTEISEDMGLSRTPVREALLRLSRQVQIEKRIALDEQWHEVLLSRYENKRLKDAIEELKAVVRRYEFGYMRDTELMSHSVNDHAHLLHIIEEKGTPAAIAGLEKHWRYSMENLLKRIK